MLSLATNSINVVNIVWEKTAFFEKKKSKNGLLVKMAE